MPNKFTYRIIRRIYEACLWKRGDLDGLRVAVTGVGGKVHHFHERRLKTYRPSLQRMLLTHMPERLMRSKGSKGLPWYSARWDKDGTPIGSNDIAELFVALCVGADLMSITFRRVEGVEEVTAYVIVEDGKIIYRQKVDECRRVMKYHERRKKP